MRICLKATKIIWHNIQVEWGGRTERNGEKQKWNGITKSKYKERKLTSNVSLLTNTSKASTSLSPRLSQLRKQAFMRPESQWLGYNQLTLLVLRFYSRNFKEDKHLVHRALILTSRTSRKVGGYLYNDSLTFQGHS